MLSRLAGWLAGSHCVSATSTGAKRRVQWHPSIEDDAGAGPSGLAAPSDEAGPSSGMGPGNGVMYGRGAAPDVSGDAALAAQLAAMGSDEVGPDAAAGFSANYWLNSCAFENVNSE